MELLYTRAWLGLFSFSLLIETSPTMECSSRNFHLQSSNLGIALRRISTMSFFFFHLILLPSVTPVSFTFDSFNLSNPDMEYEGDAFQSNGVIQLTKDQYNCSGRAIYGDPVRIWDKATGRLADFTTHFSFSIDTLHQSNHGDGLAFFLAANKSLPSNSAGSCLGLVNCENELSTPPDAYVAVEFDTFPNPWDPKYDHIGINVNSLNSVETVGWRCESKARNKARVSYDSSTKNFSVFLSYDDSPTAYSSASRPVDLRKYLPEWVTIGFSASTGGGFQIHSVLDWDFQSSLGAVEIPRNRTINETEKVTFRVPTIVLVLCGVVILLLGFSWLIWFLWRKKRSGSNERQNGSKSDVLEQTRDQEDRVLIKNDQKTRREPASGTTGIVFPKKFSYRELVDATDNFTEEIGKGASGQVFKGFLVLADQNLKVAIKKFPKEACAKGVRQFESEVKTLGQLRHENLVQLYGSCDELNELLLVYEFMPNGSLWDHLFKKNRLLAWKERYEIVLGLAKGLLHLHEEGGSYIIHRDIKSSNILLDENFKAKLGDFGLARMVEEGEDPLTTYIAGTEGYLAPECERRQKRQRPSRQSDVYSFGIVALEIGCGRRALEHVDQPNEELVQRVRMLYDNGNILEAVDPRLKEFDENEMNCLLAVGLRCAHPEPSARPTIREAINMLLQKAPLPPLPHEMPRISGRGPSNDRPPVKVDGSSSSGKSFVTAPSGRPNEN